LHTGFIDNVRDKETRDMADTLQHRYDEISPPWSREDDDAESLRAGGERIQVRIADKLRQAADSLISKTEDNKTPRELANLGSQAGSWLHNSADYIEQMEPKKVKEDITEQVRRNPGRSLLVAGAVGLVLGAIFRRR